MREPDTTPEVHGLGVPVEARRQNRRQYIPRIYLIEFQRTESAFIWHRHVS